MRVIFYLIVGVVVLTLLRSVLGAISGAFSGGSSSPAPSPGTPQAPAPQSLKKDPVCGTFVAASTDLQKTRGGETYYFCSAACRDKF